MDSAALYIQTNDVLPVRRCDLFDNPSPTYITNMVLKHKPGYTYRFHRHTPGANEPRAQQSPHVSPSTIPVARMPDIEQPVPSAHYYPPTWDAHPMLPPGTIGTTPRASATGPARIDTPPTVQTPMSAKTTPSPPGGQTGQQHADGGRESWSDWVCCARKKVGRAVRDEAAHVHALV